MRNLIRAAGALSLLFSVALGYVPAEERSGRLLVSIQPPSPGSTSVRVEVVNSSDGAVENIELLLNVHSAGGVIVERSIRHGVGALAADKSVIVQIDAAELLPKGLGMRDATFVLQAKAGAMASEELRQTASDPDLAIRDHHFVPGAPARLKVEIVNTSTAAAAPSVLLLIVDKYQDIPIRERLSVPIEAVPAGRQLPVQIDASAILPNGVPLAEATFKLLIDPEDQIRETNEENNTRAHP
jgi:hypothetical protein